MPPRRFSRYTFAEATVDDVGALVLSEPEPFRFQALDDNRQHRVLEGDDLFTLAGRYFQPLQRPSGLWWIIADFQPDPILDPTLRLEVGRMLWIPSVRTVTELIFNESRRGEES